MTDKFKYSEAELNDFLDGIFAGTITEHAIPENIYFAIADYLKGGLYHGFGGNLTDFKGKDLELLTELRENIYMFSAAKSYQQVKEISSLMLNENGELRSNREFNKLGAEAFDTWNKSWGATEHNTAVASAQAAVKWNEIEKNKDILPVLSYSTIGDACDICAPLDGMTAPVDDPIWNSIYAPNHFNCLCIVTQHEEKDLTPDKEKEATIDLVTGEMNDAFKMNSGKDGYIFSPGHPYFEVAPRDSDFAKVNFNLPIPTVAEEIGKAEFVAAKTTREAEDYARDTLGMQYANYKRIDIALVNDMNREAFNLKQIMPELPTNGIGNAQEANKAMKQEIMEFYRKGSFYDNIKTQFGVDTAERQAAKFAGKYIPKVQSGTFAHSTNLTEIRYGGNVLDLSKYRGVYINEVNGKSKAVIDLAIKRNQDSKWFVPGKADFSHVMNHELGHEIDKLINFKNSPEFKEIFIREHKLGLQSVTDRLSKYGATAGKISSHRPDEMIAEAWTEFTTSKAPRPLAKEIGDLMLKKYHAGFVKDSGVKLEQWMKTTTKILQQ